MECHRCGTVMLHVASMQACRPGELMPVCDTVWECAVCGEKLRERNSPATEAGKTWFARDAWDRKEKSP